MDPVSHAQSDVGRVRDNNEDRHYCNDACGVYAVADGIGGKPGGEVASQLIVDAIAERAETFRRLVASREGQGDDHVVLTEADRQAVFAELIGALRAINQKLYRRSSTHASQSGMGSTVDMVVVGRRCAFICHVGDSRVYLLRDDEIFRVTRDHTYAEHLREHPRDATKGVEPERYSHVLTRSMGGEPTVDIDPLFVDLEPGDRLVLCTDGVTDYLSGAQILDVHLRVTDSKLPSALVDCANERGGKDNATAVVVDIPEDDDAAFSRARTRPDTFQSVRFLQTVDLFARLEFQEMLKILHYLRSERRQKGEVIIARGDPVDGLYFVMSGRLAVELDGASVDEIDVGGHFGEFGLFGEPMRVADVRCLEDCEILFLPKDNLERLLHTEPVLTNKLLWRLLARTSEIIQKMMTDDDDRR